MENFDSLNGAENGSVGDVLERINKTVDELLSFKEECLKKAEKSREVDKILNEMGEAQKSGEPFAIPALIPMFGGVAMLSAVLCTRPKNIENGNAEDDANCTLKLSDEYYLRSNVKEAREFLRRGIEKCEMSANQAQTKVVC